MMRLPGFFVRRAARNTRRSESVGVALAPSTHARAALPGANLAEAEVRGIDR